MLALGRRGFLGGGLAVLATGCVRTPPRFFGPGAAPVGVQLYSVAKEAMADLDATLQALAKIGYRTVELAGYAGKTPKELRAALDRAGLTCVSAHVPGKPFRPAPRTLEDDPALIAEEAHILGFDTVVMPLFVSPPHLPMKLETGGEAKPMVNAIAAKMTADDWKWVADYMNQRAAGLKAHGLKFAFHNHGNEFMPVNGRSAMELLIAETQPGLVSFQLDCGWAVSAGVDPAEFLVKHAGRVTALHLKDVAATNKPNFELRMDPAEIGQGITDWIGLLSAARKTGIERFFVEQEAPYTRPVLDTLRDNFAYLSGLGD